MNETMKNVIKLCCFILCLGLIIIGQKTIGVAYLGMMIVGLAGLLALLYFYNKKYQ